MYENQWPCRTSSLSTRQNLTSNASFLFAFLHCSSVFDNQRKYSVLCLVYYFSVLEYMMKTCPHVNILLIGVSISVLKLINNSLTKYKGN